MLISLLVSAALKRRGAAPRCAQGANSVAPMLSFVGVTYEKKINSSERCYSKFMRADSHRQSDLHLPRRNPRFATITLIWIASASTAGFLNTGLKRLLKSSQSLLVRGALRLKPLEFLGNSPQIHDDSP